MKNNSTNYSKTISFRKNRVIIKDSKNHRNPLTVVKYGSHIINNFIPFGGNENGRV